MIILSMDEALSRGDFFQKMNHTVRMKDYDR
jgi:hypothetical protein